MPRISLVRIAPRAMLAAGAAIPSLLPIAGAMAQQNAPQVPDGYTYQAPPPGGDYRQPAPPPPQVDPNWQGNNGPQGQQGYPPPQGQQAYAPPPEPAPPPGYDGSQPPPPPPGYNANPGQWQASDQRYAADAERWARDNCVKAHGDVGAGAVIGGILGAVIGGSMGGRHDGGAGALLGGALGAGAGAVVASNADSGATSPGCPPGFVVRRDAYQWSAAPAGYYYAAPGWYQPWVFIDGGWVYRPYPYHDWYWHTYRGGYYGHGYYGHGGYGGGWHGGEHGRRGW